MSNKGVWGIVLFAFGICLAVPSTLFLKIPLPVDSAFYVKVEQATGVLALLFGAAVIGAGIYFIIRGAIFAEKS